MKRLLIIFALLIAPLHLLAQSEDDEGYLTRLIEENLSGVSRTVDIRGFEGALSSAASLDVLTIADAEGVWLQLEDVVLEWSRTALLRGAIDVQELSAARVIVSRPPVSEDGGGGGGPAPEATPFALPELPVSVRLDQLNVDEIVLGEAFLGEEIRVSLTGSAQLADGEGAANITATRLGEKTGVFAIDGAYANATRQLALALNIEEGPDGIAARLLDLPGRPAIRLAVEGDAPIDDFAATLAIATDGQDRLNGDFALTDVDGETRITLDVGGDISPLFLPEYQGFFGTDARLSAEVIQTSDGRIDIPTIDLDAGRVTLQGALRIGRQGWPTLIELSGGITSADGGPVLLPLTGPQTFVDGMTLDVSYDLATADDWRADIRIDGLTRPGLGIETLRLSGGGVLRNGEEEAIGAVTADLTYGATGLQLDNSGAAEAFGDEIAGVFVASRTEGEPLEITQLTLSGAGVEATANASIAGPDTGFQTEARLEAEIAGLARFSTLAGRPLGGAAEIALAMEATPLDGLFDVTLDAQTDDLSIGQAEADAILAGPGTVSARAVRDTAGTRLERLRVATDAARITGSAELTSDGADAQVAARLNELSLILPELSGPATVEGTVRRASDGAITFDLQGTGPAAEIAGNGTVTPAETGQTVNASLRAAVDDLSRYAALVGRPIAGATDLQINGVILSDGMRFDAEIMGSTDDIVTGEARIDPLLTGAGRISAGIARTGEAQFRLSDLDLRTPQMALRGSAAIDLDAAQTADITFQINDASRLDPSLSGPIRLTLNANPMADDDTATQVSLTGPGTDLRFDGVLSPAARDFAIAGDLEAVIENLGTYADLVGQPIRGSVDLSASGSLVPDLSRMDARVRLQSEDLGIGNPTADALLAGTGRINADVGLADGVLALRTLEVSTREVSIVAALNGAAGQGQGRFNASLRDVGVLTDQISGPIRATGSASLDDAGTWGVDANATGPGGLAARIVGDYRADGTLAMDVNGAAPLALANTAIAPRRLSGTANFDLSVNGPPGLDALGGRVTFSDGRLAAPTLGTALTDLGGRIGLSNGQALIDLSSRVEGGGQITVNGIVGLTGNNNADVTVGVRRLVLQDPELYSTEVRGDLTLSGPLRGGARIAGRFELGQTDIQVPSSSISSLGELPDVIHRGTPADVRQTLSRAGLSINGTSADGGGDGNGGGGGRAFPLDIVIDAPSRIFIRGRGLDAELGGRLTIGGTTDNVIPVGRFSLIRGRIDILQQRFELTEGTASMQGDFEPFIRLVATTDTSTGTVVSIIVEGPAAEPEVRFESVPELPQDEVLAQLIFGRDLSSISPLQAVQLAAAISTLAGRGGGALDRLRSNIGLDDFDVTTDEEGNAAVRAGKYLSDNVYTDVTVTSEGETEINLNLDITDEITAKGSVDQDGETGIGIFFERDY